MGGAERGPLTPREWDVADLVATGMGNHDIADRLYISERTVETHVEHIFRKLGVNSRTRIATWVIEQRHGQALRTGATAGLPHQPLHNLPHSLTTFVGRDRELRLVRQLLLLTKPIAG
jgi:DNA-binding CsgD family transcriptional regulator